MNHYLLIYTAGPDYATRRSAHRAEHLHRAWAARARGELVLGGAFADPIDGEGVQLGPQAVGLLFPFPLV
ncbi:MAG: hypothetical protein ACKOFW_09975, partial [Planctomycetaceae bacterium]